MSLLTIVLWSTDITRLSSFLESVAGAELEAKHPGFASLSIGGVRIEIHADEDYAGHPWFDALRHEGAARGIGSELRVQVDDVDAAWRKADSEGAATVQAPVDVGNGYECVVLGPDGYLISLHKPSNS